MRNFIDSGAIKLSVISDSQIRFLKILVSLYLLSQKMADVEMEERSEIINEINGNMDHFSEKEHVDDVRIIRLHLLAPYSNFNAFGLHFNKIYLSVLSWTLEKNPVLQYFLAFRYTETS